MDNYIPPISINTPPRRPLKARAEAVRKLIMKKILFVVLTRLKYDTNRCNIFGFGCRCGSGDIFATEIIKYTISIYASSAP